ncbi:MAG: hypothetical protein KJS66_05265 [Acidobacteria bacterium]|nr:hypothetical protein [Acidobacteriota bacterium]
MDWGTVETTVVVVEGSVLGGGVVDAETTEVDVWVTSSGMEALANTSLSAITGFDDVPTSVERIPDPANSGEDSRLRGSGAVANHVFFSFTTPHTQSTPAFFRGFPGDAQATARPLADIVV